MRIEVKGRSLTVTDDMRETVERRFDKVAKQVSELALLEVEFYEEKTAPGGCVAEATLHLKGVTLRARDASRDLKHSINLIGDDMARQVKRHRDKRRGRREARTETPPMPFEAPTPESPGGAAAMY